MPKQNLTPKFVSNPPRPTTKQKVDYFDTQLSGFLLEVRSSGKATYYLRYRDKGGQLKQVKIGTPETVGLDDARSKAKALKGQTVIGFDPKAEQERLKAVPTFRDFVYDSYFPYAKTYKKSWEQDLMMIEKRMLKLWGRRKLNDITTHDLIEFQNGLVKGGMKPASVNRYMALAKYLFNLAERWEILDKAPTKNVRKLEDNGARERYLDQDEVYRLLEALNNCKSQVVPDIIEFLLLTGARKSEAAEMAWQEVDLERGIWELPAQRNKAGKPKIVPLSDAALQVLQRRAGNESNYVFPNPDTGEPLKHFHNTWDRIRKQAGIPDVRIHDLRHSFASFLVNSGRSLYEVQKLLGHSQLSTTQRYAHLTQDTLKEATEIAGGKVGMWKGKNEE